MKTIARTIRLVRVAIVLFFILFLLSNLTMAFARAGSSNEQHPQNASKDWRSKVQWDIRESEYNVIWQETTDIPGVSLSWQAPNHAHNLLTHFLPDGIRFTTMDHKERSWVFGLSFIKYGIDDSSIDLLPVIPGVKEVLLIRRLK